MAFKKSLNENTAPSYNVEKIYGTLGEDDKKYKIQLRLVSWGGRDSKYDIRTWYNDENGNEKCGKGISLTGEQAEVLMNLLQEIANE